MFLRTPRAVVTLAELFPGWDVQWAPPVVEMIKYHLGEHVPIHCADVSKLRVVLFVQCVVQVCRCSLEEPLSDVPRRQASFPFLLHVFTLVRVGGIVDVWVVRCGLLFGNVADVDVGQVVVFVASKNVGEKSLFFAGSWVRAPFEYDILDLACFIAALAFEEFIVALRWSTVDAGEVRRSYLVERRFFRLFDVEWHGDRWDRYDADCVVDFGLYSLRLLDIDKVSVAVFTFTFYLSYCRGRKQNNESVFALIGFVSYMCVLCLLGTSLV
jgi:hypothetical protein